MADTLADRVSTVAHDVIDSCVFMRDLGKREMVLEDVHELGQIASIEEGCLGSARYRHGMAWVQGHVDRCDGEQFEEEGVL